MFTVPYFTVQQRKKRLQIKDYAPVFGVEMIWDEAEKYSADKKARTEAALSDGEIILGHL